GLKRKKLPRRMGKEEVEGCEGGSVTGTYEILVIPKVEAEGARGEFHNFRNVPKITPDRVTRVGRQGIGRVKNYPIRKSMEKV
ncbi:MAG: hypothetical protein H6R26_1971, partial [Proteobacteria bacterium]|nr:hypothetical protein [Pseudomonadota bacterium]